MIAGGILKDGQACDLILQHIRECDRMYRQVYGRTDSSADSTACKKLMKLGFELNADNLPDLCIQHCKRWRLPEERPPRQPHGQPGWQPPSADSHWQNPP